MHVPGSVGRRGGPAVRFTGPGAKWKRGPLVPKKQGKGSSAVKTGTRHKAFTLCSLPLSSWCFYLPFYVLNIDKLKIYIGTA